MNVRTKYSANTNTETNSTKGRRPSLSRGGNAGKGQMVFDLINTNAPDQKRRVTHLMQVHPKIDRCES